MIINYPFQCVSHGPRSSACVCGPSYVGAQCDLSWNQQTPHFSGDSYIKFLNPSNHSLGDVMFSVVFKVAEKNGILLTTDTTGRSTDFLTAGLSRGRVYLVSQII